MISFKDFVKKISLKNKAASIKKTYQVLSSLYLNDVGIYLRDRPLESDIGITNLHQSKTSHWVAYINGIYFDSYGCVPPSKQSKLNIKGKGYCFYCEYKIQGLASKKDSYCASCCFYIIY